MEPDLLLSTASGFGLPTGDKDKGLGEGNTSFAQYLFADKALGRWSANINLGVGANMFGEHDGWLEYGAGIAYSFIRDVKWNELAPARPAQSWVLSPSLELVWEHSFHQLNLGQHTTSWPRAFHSGMCGAAGKFVCSVFILRPTQRNSRWRRLDIRAELHGINPGHLSLSTKKNAKSQPKQRNVTQRL